MSNAFRRKTWMSLHLTARNCAIAAVAAAALLVGTDRQAPAQLVANADPGQPVDQVFVRDSAGAVEKFALAERMERLKEWGKAGDIYQEVLTNYADRVVPAQSDGTENTNGGEAQYTSVGAAVQERLARWPREGLEAYRSRYETPARSLLNAASPDDVAALHKVYATYFVTDAAKAAGIRLIDLAMERGDFASAARVAQRLLSNHPELGTDRPAVTFRTIVAAHNSGDEKNAQDALADLQKNSSDALGKVRGQDIRLVDAANEVLAAPAPTKQMTASANDDSSWRTLLGDASRSKTAPAVTSLGAKLFSIDLAKPDSGPQAQARMEIERAQNPDVYPLSPGIFPAIDRDEIYFHDNAYLYAVNVESGLPLPGWAATYDGERAGRYPIGKSTALPRNQHETITLSDDSVYAVVGLADAIGINVGMPNAAGLHASRVICLDRKTGRERFVVRPSQITGDRVPPTLKDLDFSGSALLVDDLIYLTARGGKGPQFEDCYVVCLSATDGSFRWATYVASASAPGLDPDMGESFPSSQTLSHLAFASGRVFCGSNLGALAAIDAYDGSVAWLTLYPRQGGSPMNPWQRQFRPQNQDRPGSFNPLIVVDGKVFSLPSDGKELAIYDAQSGKRIKRLPLKVRVRQVPEGQPVAIETDEVMQTLIGVQGNQLFVCGPRTVACFDWTADTKGNEAIADRPGKMPLWFKRFERPSSLPRNAGNRSGQVGGAGGMAVAGAAPRPAVGAFGNPNYVTISGRPFLSRDSLYVPTLWKLQCVSLKGRVAWTYPSGDTSWSDGEEAGNVLATSQTLVVAGTHKVSVYTDLAMALAKLDAAVLAAPTEPEPRLRYAEVMFVSGRTTVAVEKLNEAVKLLGGIDAMPVNANRQRVYLDSLTFAQRVSRDAIAANKAIAATTSPGASAKNSAATAPSTGPASTASTNPSTLPAATRPTAFATLVDSADHLFDLAIAAANAPGQQVGARLSRATFAHNMNDVATELRLYHEILAKREWRSMAVARRDANNASGTASIPVAQLARSAIEQLLQRGDGRELFQAYEARAAKEIDAARTALNPNDVLEVAAMYPNAHASADAAAWAAEAFEAAGNPKLAEQTLRQLYQRATDTRERVRLLESIARNDLALPDRADVAAARIAQAVRLTSHEATEQKLSRPIKLPDGRVLESDTSLKAVLTALHTARVARVQSALPDLRLAAAGQRSPFKSDAPAVIAENISDIYSPARGFERNDRLVVSQAGKGVAVFSPTSKSALFTSSAIMTRLNGCAWTGGNLLVWNRQKIAMLDGEAGNAVWQMSSDQLPSSEVIDAATSSPLADVDVDGDDSKTAAVDRNVEVREDVNRAIRVQGQLRIVGGGQVFVRNGNGVFVQQAVQVAGNQANESDDGNEVIIHVRPLADRVVLTTSRGRVLAFNLADGKVTWQVMNNSSIAGSGAPGDGGTILRLEATDDFVAVQSANSNGGGTLDAYDAASGQRLFSQPISGDGQAATQITNIAMGTDGLLVWVSPDRVSAKDLFDPPGAGLRFGSQPQPGDESTLPYSMASTPGTLVLEDGHLLVLADGGTNVRELSLETGELLKGSDGTPLRRSTGMQPTENVSMPPVMRLVNSILYIQSASNLIAHDLDRDGVSWTITASEVTDARLNECIIGREDVVVAASTLLAQEVQIRAQAVAAAAAAAAAADAQRQQAANQNAQQQAQQQVPVQPPPGQPIKERRMRGTKSKAPPELKIFAHSRERLPNGNESGNLKFYPPFTVSIQPPLLGVTGVDGGIYFLANDRKLRYLPGAQAGEP